MVTNNTAKRTMLCSVNKLHTLLDQDTLVGSSQGLCCVEGVLGVGKDAASSCCVEGVLVVSRDVVSLGHGLGDEGSEKKQIRN